ncbi:MAG: hypothetical protein Q8S26_07920 [Azonexus sp.]|nr:hypothetical protein [Azonexus sp.]
MAVLLLAWTALAGAETWHFGLIGDVPYSEHERTELPVMLSRITESQVEFIAHVGDFKNGQDRCDDSLFEDRYRLFNSSSAPFVFVPGDNEWTDCERLSNGGYDPLERLGKLRGLFWRDQFSLGRKKLSMDRQSGKFPEHARFRLGPVLFVTFNLPGGNNNYGKRGEASSEFKGRNPAVLAWLTESFALARREKLAGVVLLFQANPGFKHFSQGLAHEGYRAFLESLQAETMNFAGQVVVVHGDSHTSRIDHPLRDAQGKRLANFTRVETFGYPLMGWTRGTIDTGAPALFRFETHAWPTKGY